MVFNNELLKQMYVEYSIPCDRLVSNPSMLYRFTREYIQRSGQEIAPAHLSHHLLNLRRLGEAKGGLSRLRRIYNGRNSQN
jgi:hypothetical protein